MDALLVQHATIDGSSVSISCVDGRIDALGPDVTAPPGTPTFDANHAHAIPGFVNAHGHAAMTLLRGYGDDLALMPWLEDRIWPAEQRLTPDDVYWGTRLAALEMLRSGTTTACDMYWYGQATAAAFRDAGMRAQVATALWDFHDPATTADALRMAEASLTAIADCGPLVTASLGPHAVYTCSEPLLRDVAKLAVDAGCFIQIHCSETADEVEQSLARFGRRPTQVLADTGLLTDRTLLAHCCYLDAGDRRLIAEAGAIAVTNPVSNAKLAGGAIFDFPTVDAAGIRVALGTDGAASNNSLDLLADLKTFALLQRHAAGRPDIVPAADLLRVARGAAAGLGEGQLRPGATADIVFLDPHASEIAIGELDANLIYAASSRAVQSVIVNGNVVMADRVVADEATVLDEARRCAQRLRSA